MVIEKRTVSFSKSSCQANRKTFSLTSALEKDQQITKSSDAFNRAHLHITILPRTGAHRIRSPFLHSASHGPRPLISMPPRDDLDQQGRARLKDSNPRRV